MTNDFINAIFGHTDNSFCVTVDNGTPEKWTATYSTREIACAVLHDIGKPGTVIDTATGELIDYID